MPRGSHSSAQLWTEKNCSTSHCLSGYLRVEFRKSEKSSRILGISGFWNFFWICEIPLFSTLTGHAKCGPFWRLGALTDIRTAMAQKNRNTLLVFLGCLEVKLCKSEKSARILRSSGLRHFFRICEIPLLVLLQAMWSAAVIFPYMCSVELCVSNQS